MQEPDPLVDQVAIQLFCKGWPIETIYQRAELFMKVRAAHLAGLPVLPEPAKAKKGLQKR